MKKIGTANIIWKEFDNFVKTEKEHSMKKEPGWYVSVRWSVPREIQDILWSMYTKTGEGKDADVRLGRFPGLNWTVSGSTRITWTVWAFPGICCTFLMA